MELEHANQDDSEYFSVHFFLTAIVTLLGITGFVTIPDFYLKGLFAALLLELIAIVIAAGKVAFTQAADVEHYKWELSYFDDLRPKYESFFLKDPNFASFYALNKSKKLSAIHDDTIAEDDLKRLLDTLFVIKKADEFCGKEARGEMFLIKEKERDATNFGTAVLTFPYETQPIAFTVTSEPESGRKWEVSFGQPDRFVEYQGRINTWRGAKFKVKFTSTRKGEWSGPLSYGGIDIATVILNRTA